MALHAVQRRYFAGNTQFGEVLEREAAQPTRVDGVALLGYLRRRQEILHDHLLTAVEQEYLDERDRLAASPEQRRREIVLGFLAGSLADVTGGA